MTSPLLHVVQQTTPHFETFFKQDMWPKLDSVGDELLFNHKYTTPNYAPTIRKAQERLLLLQFTGCRKKFREEGVLLIYEICPLLHDI